MMVQSLHNQGLVLPLNQILVRMHTVVRTWVDQLLVMTEERTSLQQLLLIPAAHSVVSDQLMSLVIIAGLWTIVMMVDSVNDNLLIC